MIAVLAALAFALPVAADPATNPELVPFTGTRTLTATWGAPSGGYRAYPGALRWRAGFPSSALSGTP